MSWQQVINLWGDYGPGAIVVLIIIVLLVIMAWAARTLVKWWPVITQFVSTINIVAKLPNRLDKIDADNDALNTRFDEQKKASTDLAAKFVEHLSDAKAKTDLLREVSDRLISVESKAEVAANNAGVAADNAVVAATRADQAAEQLRNNGGSTIKDKVDKLIPDELAEIKRMLAKVMDQLAS